MRQLALYLALAALCAVTLSAGGLVMLSGLG